MKDENEQEEYIGVETVWSNTDGGYNVNRVWGTYRDKYATFICESNAEEYAQLKRDQLEAGQGI